MSQVPSPGDVILVTRKASVQFVEPMTFRVIKVLTELVTYHGWVWLRGYQLDDKGRAVASRELFVQPAGLVTLRERQAPQPATLNARRRRNMPPPASATRRTGIGVWWVDGPAPTGSPPTVGARRGDVLICQDRRMPVRERPVVIAVCGCPGAGKTTVASATAGHLGIPFLTRDEIKAGLGLSSASVGEDGRVRLDGDFHLAGGPVSLRAEAVMVDAARLLAASGVSFVVESSVLSHQLLGVLLAGDARVLAVHVVAREAVIGRRLVARAAGGGAVGQQLLALFQRGELKRSIFVPPEGVDAVVEVDTSDDAAPVIETVVAAAVALLG
ncbi:AAA family ATPase [Micromonospora haikouensis]|uniref:AAA family ATPase n=1 Tax=Micromonospora haikouensis TaxID=686309 RepID=UPI003D71B80C